MTTIHRFVLTLSLGVALTFTLGACATSKPANTPTANNTYQGTAQPQKAYSGYGVVQSMDTVHQEYQGVGGTGYGLGTLAGAVIGGAAGSQVGHGDGQKAATVAGTAGGAYVGHQIEKKNLPPDLYVFTVRMDSGAHQSVTMETTGGLIVGDRVRIDTDGSMRRY